MKATEPNALIHESSPYLQQHAGELVLGLGLGTGLGGMVPIPEIQYLAYLHNAIDDCFEKVVKPRCKGDAMICRYADDFVCAFQYARDAE